MNMKTSTIKSIPVMLIDFRNNRIRIHKNTLRLMGNPDYVLFLINPQNQTLALRTSSASDTLAHKVRWSLVDHGQCCEFYSKQLVYTIRNYFSPLFDKQAYRFYGEIISPESIAVFSLADSSPIKTIHLQKVINRHE